MEDTKTDIDALAARCLRICKTRGWVAGSGQEGLLSRGCYIHLEVSEFIEALRGKGDSPPDEEAADVLFCLLSLLLEKGYSPSKVLLTLSEKCDKLFGPDKCPSCGGQVQSTAPAVFACTKCMWPVSTDRRVRTCNLHTDCDRADDAASAKGRLWADHCNDDCCEDCFGQ